MSGNIRVRFIELTKAEYAATSQYINNAFYYCTDTNELFKGNKKIVDRAVYEELLNKQDKGDYATRTELNSAITNEASIRAAGDNNLQSQIDAITVSSDVVDVVGTHAQLEDYTTTSLNNDDIIKVLADETQHDATTYYRWIKQFKFTYDAVSNTITYDDINIPPEGVEIQISYDGQVQETYQADGTSSHELQSTPEDIDTLHIVPTEYYWSLVGSEGPYYRKAEADVKFQFADVGAINAGKYIQVQPNGKLLPVTLDVASLFIVEYTESNNEWSTSTSFVDILDAHQSGKVVVADVQDFAGSPHVYFQLASILPSTTGIVFTLGSYDLTAALLHSSEEDVTIIVTTFDSFQQKLHAGNGIDLDGATISVKSKSYKFVDYLPLTNIQEDTDYLTRGSGVSYGDFCANNVLYPTDTLPPFQSLVNSGDRVMLWYNSYHSKFYLLRVTNFSTFYWHFDSISAPSGRLQANGGYIYTYLYTIQNNAWVQISSGGDGLYLEDATTSKRVKFLYTKTNFTYSTNSNYTVTTDSTKIGVAGYIYANFFNPSTGEYLGDADNVDYTSIYNFDINQYRDNAWSVVGQLDMQNVLGLLAKTSDVNAALATKLDKNQGINNVGKVMQVGVDGNLTPADLGIEVTYV